LAELKELGDQIVINRFDAELLEGIFAFLHSVLERKIYRELDSLDYLLYFSKIQPVEAKIYISRQFWL
jgi:hypothetical protein